MKACCITIFRYFFLILFLGFFGSNTFFDHTHIYEGNIIVHSHPFKSDRDGKPLHSHNDSGYLLINLLNCYIANIVFGFSLASVMLFLSEEIITRTITSFCTRIGKSSILLRGPPAWMLN